MITIISTFKRNRQVNKRAYPLSNSIGFVIIGISIILVPIFIYRYLFQGAINDRFIEYAQTNNYITFITIGSAFSVFTTMTLFNCSRAFITEIREGTLDNFLISPCSRISYYVGVFFEQVFRSSFVLFVSISLGIIFGARFPMCNIFSYITALGLLLLSNFAVAVSLSAVMVFTRDTYITQNTIFSLMYFICGMLFPVQYLPIPLQYLAQIFPLTHALNLMRSITLSGMALFENLNSIIAIVGLSLLYFIIGHFSFMKLEKKLIENVLS